MTSIAFKRSERAFLQNLYSFFVANMLITFVKCTYRVLNLFSFRGKSIQLPIQYLFSRYSVLRANLFSHLFSFRGVFIQFCELIFKAMFVLPFKLSPLKSLVWALFDSDNMVKNKMPGIFTKIRSENLYKKTCNNNTTNNLL